MRRKLRTKRGRERYALRMETVEPVFGQYFFLSHKTSFWPERNKAPADVFYLSGAYELPKELCGSNIVTEILLVGISGTIRRQLLAPVLWRTPSTLVVVHYQSLHF